MAAAPLAFDEAQRLQRLHALGVLDTPPDPRFDTITSRACAIVHGASIAAISLIDADRQWFKSIVGLNVTETPRDLSFCAHVILGSRVMIVPDATRDRRFADNELVTSLPSIRFYAGVPLSGGAGALCVIGTAPYRPTPSEIKGLQELARLADTQLLMHGVLRALHVDGVATAS